MPKYIKPTINKNKITRGWKTGISSILLQSDLNKWRLSKLTKIDNLYIIYASAGLLQRSNIGFTEYKNKIFKNNWHINLRACDTAPLYHFPSPITG